MVLDAAGLDRLAEELESRRHMADVAERYRRMLPDRVTRLTMAVDSGQHDVAMDAVLSLRVSSATVGAREMQHLAAGVEADVRRGDLAEARRGTELLPAAARRVDLALADFLRPDRAC